jgi:hypothetical protein
MSIQPINQIIYNPEFVKTNVSIDLAWNSDGTLGIDDAFLLEASTDYTELTKRILHCVLTETGEIPHRPDWGVGISALQNDLNSSGGLAKVAAKTRSQLSNKNYFPEVTSIDSISFTTSGNQVGINISVSTIYGELSL